MKPTERDLLAELQRRALLPDPWMNHAALVAFGGHRYNGRLFDLRKKGFRFEHRGNGERSEWRFVDGLQQRYAEFSCACGWTGTELTAGGGRCGRCGTVLVTEDNRQEVLAL